MKTYSIAVVSCSAATMIAACAAARTNEPGGFGQGGGATSASSAGGAALVSASAAGGGSSASASVVTTGGSSGSGSGPSPQACLVTCVNEAPNHEAGCDPCMKSVCPGEYAACAADVSDAGCVSCSDLLGKGGNGLDCDESAAIMNALLSCACTHGTCN